MRLSKLDGGMACRFGQHVDTQNFRIAFAGLRKLALEL
jgi:hypothetical protein